jgi:uncharacterized protein (TIGR00269 family)
MNYIERRVKKDLKKQGRIPDNSRIGIALSGGKDSTVALHLMHMIYHKRPTICLYAISVDEGIKGYRDQSLEIAKDNCELLDIEHHIIHFKEVIGTTMDAIAKKNGDLGECTYCGVFRRFCLNLKTKELGITRLITGHNLDDMAQSILMNFTNGDIQKLARLGPHLRIREGLVPRILPLRTIPEKEIMLYALLKKISFHDGECPYSYRASRGQFRDIVDQLEETNPGTRHSILNSYETLRESLQDLYPSAEINTCKSCGEPTSQNMCKTCILKKRIHS